MCGPTPPAFAETAQRAGWSGDQITTFSRELSEATKRAYEGWTPEQTRALYELTDAVLPDDLPRRVIVQSGRRYGLTRRAASFEAQWPGLAEAAVEGAHQP